MIINDPHVGDRIEFVPSAFVTESKTVSPEIIARLRMAYSLSGRIVYVNREHRYYTAEAECFGRRIRESYKF